MTTEEEEESNKRAALAGQWRTPPLPAFANSSSNSSTTFSVAAAAAPTSVPEGPITSSSSNPNLATLDKLPMSTEDYLKALQEAYLRGAEAAAAMAAKQQQQQQQQGNQPGQALQPPLSPVVNLGSALSCPNFRIVLTNPAPPQQQQQPDPSTNTAAAAAAASTAASVPNPLMSNPSMPPPPPVPPMVTSNAQVVTAAAPEASPSNLMVMQPPQQQLHPLQQPHLHAQVDPFQPPPQIQHPHAHATAVVTQQQQQQQQRSMSLPDMTSYAAQQEEQKRRKRLARNRASARLRRLRKKNLVDAYETEVGILEKTLAKLRTHEWGTRGEQQMSPTDEQQPQQQPPGENNENALIEAISMDRGQQELNPQERRQAAADTLQQQLAFCAQLEELMQEQYVLYHLASTSTDPNNSNNDQDEFQDLRQALQLTPEQVQHLQQTAAGWSDEWAALQTVKESLVAMKDNAWLWDDGVASIIDPFMNILHKNQISKFLLWADNNVDAIDELDGVHAAAGVPVGPVFHFGADSVVASTGGGSGNGGGGGGLYEEEAAMPY